MSAAFFSEPTNMSLWTVAPRLGLTGLAWVLPAGVLLLSVWWACTRMTLGGGLASVTVAGLLASPITWSFYMLLALLPMSAVLGAAWQRPLHRKEIAAVAGLFALLSISQAVLIDLARGGLGPLVLLEPALALLMLGLLVARSV
jgi:hypothetical protein